jgi:hypothetical protein
MFALRGQRLKQSLLAEWARAQVAQSDTKAAAESCISNKAAHESAGGIQAVGGRL